MLKYVIVYLMIVNIIAFVMYGIDKRKAKNKQYRIPEKTLLLSAAVGGSIGAMFGMKMFRHKTKHKQFYIGVPVIFVLQCILIILIWNTTNA